MNRLLLFAIALLLIAIAAVGVVLLGGQPDLEALGAEVLADLSAGKSDQVWEESSAEFRARYPRERFSALMADFHGNLGAYQRVVSAKGPSAETPPNGAESVGEGMTFEVEYEKGMAFCFMVFNTEVSPPRLAELLLRKSH